MSDRDLAILERVEGKLDRLHDDVRQELGQVRTDIRQMCDLRCGPIEGRICRAEQMLEAMGKRVGSLEAAKAKALAAWGIIAATAGAIVTILWHKLGEWLFGGRK